ncbi:MAG: beta-N-acetylhexosaminidase [Deltaproteobacteria bacterium]|nr:beta-N-acetylhexosaminidase [Deltaproteobacteria bacterium]
MSAQVMGLAAFVLLASPVWSGLDGEALRVEKLIGQMSPAQKVGQLMMIGFGGREMGPEIARLLTELHIGSVTLYSRNVRDPAQVARLIRDIRSVMAKEIQPFIALDQEGGNVVRVRSQVAVLPGTMTLGASRDPVLAYLAGQANAVDLGLIGFDMILAPVLDINHNPKNPVINVRAFGDDPQLVASLGSAYCLGQQDGGAATVAKHFPGHGTTAHDSHFALPRIELSADQLRQTELLPFRRAIESGLDAVMTAHVQIPAIDTEGTPASLSPKVITGLLREELGFDGVVITDDLEMRAVSGHIGVGAAAIQALQAGADLIMVIWTPRRKREVHDALLAAVRDGTISAERLDRSVRRILRLKARRGTLDAPGRLIAKPTSVLPNDRHLKVVRSIAVRGLTLVRNRSSLVPLCSGKGVLVVSPQDAFRQEMKRLLPACTTMPIKLVSSLKRRQHELAQLVERAEKRRVVVLAVTNVYQAWLAQQFQHRSRTPLIVVSFGSPYMLRYFPKVQGYLCTYSYLASAQLAAAQALAGRLSITGRLPVQLSARHPRGSGLTIRRHACKR